MILGVLTCSFVICTQVSISELEGKYVGLCFVVNGFGPIDDLTADLAKIYEKLKEVGEKFEVVTVSLDSDESAFNESFSNMPWLAIPHNDKMCEKLVRYFELSTLPTLVLIGPDGKTLNNNIAEIIMVLTHGRGSPSMLRRWKFLPRRQRLKQHHKPWSPFWSVVIWTLSLGRMEQRYVLLVPELLCEIPYFSL
jgi:hypothetical protein